MEINLDSFRLSPGQSADIEHRPTSVEPICGSKKEYKKLLEHHVKELASLQQLHYASNQTALLLIFQGMDAAGKDGAIRHVMSGINPQGCQVFSFKHPSSEELSHDFLWRTACRLPERGRIGIFNRSYYEEVVAVRVHSEDLRAEGLPDESVSDSSIWKERFVSIVNFEKHLHLNGTHVIKFYLHLSKEEQRKRFLDRIDDPSKNWKFSKDDAHERDFWSTYMKVYEECLSTTTSINAPWYVIPADDKANARLIISEVIVETLKKLKMTYPKTTDKHLQELKLIRKTLA